MRVYLPRLRLDAADIRVDELERLAAKDRFHEHQLVADPRSADVVLFVQCHMVDWRLRAIRDHPVARDHWRKVMIYDERDRPWRSFPGIYVSAPAPAFDVRSQRAWSYLRVPPGSCPPTEPDLLFSFVGSLTAECRRPLFDLQHPDTLVEEVRNFMFWDTAAEAFEERRRRYAEILARSRFVLCPRGRGTSTFRLYETIAAGRVPVIISDDWVPPSGPDWDAFSLRVPEKSAWTLVDLITDRDRDWRAMSAAAAAAYRDFFSDEVAFQRIVELCRELKEWSYFRSSHWTLGGRAAAAALRARASEVRALRRYRRKT
jgi:hypothetical protein